METWETLFELKSIDRITIWVSHWLDIVTEMKWAVS